MPMVVIVNYYNTAMNIRGNIAQTNKSYQQTRQNNPFDAVTYYNLAIKYTEQSKYRAAEICYRKALWLSPHDPETWNNLGCVYLKQADYDNAKRCLEIALRYKPDYPEAQFNLKKLQELMI